MDADPPERRYMAVFDVVGPRGRLGEQAAYDSEGRPVEMATDVVLEKDGWRVFWSRAVESGLEVTDEVRRDAEQALSRFQVHWNDLDASLKSGLPERGQKQVSVWSRLLGRRLHSNGRKSDGDSDSA